MRPKSTALFVALALAAAATLPATANAQTFGDESDFAMSADRLMGVYLFDEGPEYTAIGLGASPGDHWYMRTRLGIDYFVAGSFGIGGSIAYINVDGDGRGDGNDGFLFSPRVSYGQEERFLREFYAAQRAHLEKRMLFGKRKADKYKK